MANLNIKFNNKNYSIDSALLADAFASLEGHLAAMMDEPAVMKAGLYKTGSNYTELIISWDDLVSSGAIKVIDGGIYLGAIPPANLPEKNEYGFYYGVPYGFGGVSFVFYEDGSMDMQSEDGVDSMPAGTIIYSNGAIDMSVLDIGIGTISPDGLSIVFAGGEIILSLGETPQLAGDLVISESANIVTIPGATFDSQPLTGIIVPTGVEVIEDDAFAYCHELNSIKLPVSIRSIRPYIFRGCRVLETIIFEGTMEQWNAITKDSYWNKGAPATHVHCTDGDVAL
jgi:hypothetical protein